MQIITENDIDEAAAKAYLTAGSDIELLPEVPKYSL